MPTTPVPTLSISSGSAPGATVTASGTWQVHALAHRQPMRAITATLKQLKGKNLQWDLRTIEAMDHIGAQLLWNAWGKARPASLQMAPEHEEFFKRLEATGTLELQQQRKHRLTPVMKLGFAIMDFGEHLAGFVRLIGQVTQDAWRFLRNPMRGPWREISANVYHAGFQALGITALVGFLIGVVLSFLSAQQLRTFGGDIYLVNLLGMSVIRELGPLLAAILVAGRSGSSITAQLGVMRVTEELDAMLVMGISHGFRLILPKVIALAISMPLLVIWTDTMALIGGITGDYSVKLTNGSLGGQVVLTKDTPNFTFGTPVADGQAYGVSVLEITSATVTPVKLGCSIANGTDVMGNAPRANIVVTCAPKP
eukprot:gene19288-21933_t